MKTLGRKLSRVRTLGESKVPSRLIKPRQCVYLSAPRATHHTTRYATMLSRVETRFPRARIVHARDLFATSDDWLTKWPGVIACLTELVFITNPDGTIGAGVWQEIVDAKRFGIAVWGLADADVLYPLAACRFTPVSPRSLRHHSVVTFPRGGRR